VKFFEMIFVMALLALSMNAWATPDECPDPSQVPDTVVLSPDPDDPDCNLDPNGNQHCTVSLESVVGNWQTVSCVIDAFKGGTRIDHKVYDNLTWNAWEQKTLEYTLPASGDGTFGISVGCYGTDGCAQWYIPIKSWCVGAACDQEQCVEECGGQCTAIVDALLAKFAMEGELDPSCNRVRTESGWQKKTCKMLHLQQQLPEGMTPKECLSGYRPCFNFCGCKAFGINH